MKALLLIALVGSVALAGEVPEDVRTGSADGAFLVNVVKVGETGTRRLEIASSGGKVLFTSPPQIDGIEILDFYPEHLRWSPDSRILAISAGHPKLFRTYLFAWDGMRFRQIPMPAIAADEDNPWIYPTDWKEGHRLHLRISGPHAGKASDTGYKGATVIEVDLGTMTATKVEETIERY